MNATKKLTPFEVPVSGPSFACVINWFPKSASNKFGYATVVRPGFDASKPVTVVCLFHGLGECGDGSLAALKKMTGWGGWYVPEHPESPSMFGAVNLRNIVYVMVQTSEASKGGSGEIDYSILVAHSNFNVLGLPLFCGLSLGGFAGINWGNGNAANIAKFFRFLYLMPGGNGGIGKLYAPAAVTAGVEHLFFHAIDDLTALPAQSIGLDKAIKAAGGRSNLVLYSQGGHTISTRPMGAYFPWNSVNGSTFKVEPGSFIPTSSIFDYFAADQNVVPPKLIYQQGIYQLPGGEIFAQEIK